ncbi:MAG: DUF354 domain-containing protein [bacterium]
MEIVFEINHPGQVHLLKHVYHVLTQNGNCISVFTKDDRIIKRLLEKSEMPYKILGKKGNGIYGKLFKQMLFDFKVWKHVKRNSVTIGIGSSITNDHVSSVSSMKSIHLSDDDENVVPLMLKFSYPFTNTILAPDSLTFKKFSEKTVNYAGTHELAYLHPNRFQPDKNVLNKAGLKKDEPYFIMRFVALKGHHDKGHKGITIKQKRSLINLLKPHGKIIITSESKIESEFEEYRLPVPPEEIHSLLYYSKIFLGDSQTMTSEAAVLGVPALKCNSFARLLSVPNELEDKYGLCYSYKPQEFDKFYNHLSSLLKKKNLKEEWKEKRSKLLGDKIDVSAFFVWFIENYPESARIMKENPDYQYNFK